MFRFLLKVVVVALVSFGVGVLLNPAYYPDPEYSPTELTSFLAEVGRDRLLCDRPQGNRYTWSSCYKPLPADGRAFDASNQQYRIGRYKNPIATLNHQPLTAVQSFRQWKQFFWFSVTDGDWLVNVALLDLGYIGAACVSLFNRKNLQSYSRKIELPLVLGKWFGPKWSATDLGKKGDEASYGKGEERISIESGCIELLPLFDGSTVKTCARVAKDGTPIRWAALSLEVTDDETGESLPLFASWEWAVGGPTPAKANSKGWTGPETMNLVFPVGPKRASLVSKGGAAFSWNPAPQTLLTFGERSARVHPSSGGLPFEDDEQGNEEGAEEEKKGMEVGKPSKAEDNIGESELNPTASTNTQRGVRFTLKGIPHNLKPIALSTFDYTRGLMKRHSVWDWIALSVPRTDLVTDTDAGRLVHRGVGIQLSTSVYEINQVTVENSVWVDNVIYPFEFQVYFRPLKEQVEGETIPARKKIWRVFGGPLDPISNRHVLDLLFTPYGRFDGEKNLILYSGSLVHMWGLYAGRIPVPIPTSSATSKSAEGKGKEQEWEWSFVEIKGIGSPGVMDIKDAYW